VYLRARLNGIIIIRIVIGIKILGVCKGPDRELTYEGDIVDSCNRFLAKSTMFRIMKIFVFCASTVLLSIYVAYWDSSSFLFFFLFASVCSLFPNKFR